MSFDLPGVSDEAQPLAKVGMGLTALAVGLLLLRRGRRSDGRSRSPVSGLKTSADGLAFIATEEGFRSSPYEDPGGNCTVGIGHLIRLGPCRSSDRALSKDEAVELLALDVQVAERAVRRAIVVPLAQSEFDALVSVAYNTGSVGQQVKGRLNAGDYAGAATAILSDRPTVNGRRHPVLVARRQRESVLFST